MDYDLNTCLANYAVTCEGQAREARRRAERVRSEPRAGNFPEYDRRLDLEAATADREADLWDRRAGEARKGFLLLDPSDVDYQMQNQRLVAEASAAHRVTYLEPMGDPRQPLA